MDRKRLTRRQLGLVAAASVTPLPAMAQQPAVSGAETEKARADVKRASEALRKVKVPQLLEPSFTFHP